MRSLLAGILGLVACAGRYPTAHGLAEEVEAIAGLPAEPPQCVVANHVHTLVSDRYSHAPTPENAAHAYSPAGLRSAISLFAADGVDAIVVTDHNSIAANFDPAVATAPIAVVPGMEWTTRKGHALLIGFRAGAREEAILPPPWRAPVRRGDFLAMVARTHARGGLVIVAHPRVPFRTWPDDTFGADGVEVWGFDKWFMGNRQARRWWHERLVRGERLVAMAGTDLHPGAWLRSHRHPLVRAFAPRCDADAVLGAMRGGRAVLVRGKQTPRVVIGVEGGGAIDFAEAGPGDVAAASSPIDVQVRVIGGAGTKLRVLGTHGELHARTIAGDDEATRLRLRVRSGEFVRVELHRGRKLLALSNPIYVR